MPRLVRRRRLPDGRIEEFTPMKNADGYYILADRAVDAQHNKAVNQFFVRDLEAVIARVRRGGVSLRMQGQITGQPNLISAREIKIEDDGQPAHTAKAEREDDPFACFDEWASPEDDRAYRSL